MQGTKRKNCFLTILAAVTLSLLLGLSSCRSNRVLVRFRNDTRENFQKLTARIFDSTFYFQNLESGGHTPYIKVRESYPYCSMEVITRRDTVRLFPAVFIARQLYRSGKLIISISFKPYRYNRKRLLSLSTKYQPL